MSKITAKNLSYDSSLPPFLARLQQNNVAGQRNEIQHARPTKVRSAEDEAEDEPVFFDEGSGETLTKKEWEEREKATEQAEEKAKETEKSVETGNGKKEESKEKVAAIGASKKRKVGKVVGADDEDEESKRDSKAPKVAGDNKKDEAAKNKGKAAKKGKKIKLSFGDED